MQDQIPKHARNPAWTRDEIILALDLYRQLEGNWPRNDDPRVEALSKILNGFWQSQGYAGKTLRNANGVKMKLMNLRTQDPKYSSHVGLKAGNKLEAEVWANFWEQPNHLIETANAIRTAILGSLSVDHPLTASEPD